MTTTDDLPNDIATLQAVLVAERARAAQVEAELAVAKAKASDDQALIAHPAAFEELESSATEDQVAAEQAVAKTTNVVAFTRKRPARQPFPEPLPRERVVELGPTACQCCGSPRLRKLGEDITETLEVIPAAVEGEPARPRDGSRLGRRQPAGDDPVREVRAASAADPSGRTIRLGGACRSACRPWPTRWAAAARCWHR